LESRLAIANDVKELETAKTMWRTAFFQSFIDLQECIYEKHGAKMSSRQLAKQLGVLSVMKEHVSDDFDVELSESDDE